ncbi:MAG: 16S rRNA (guanine(527)-N(7))-methyltransferase RsmG [Bacteroidetes bacterium]|nr:16S rRNA (guanine(527)-N(7))-methyltransferase RsmG [Bacteroidota bacterium]MDA0904292.1 16S rRNA (guanine(527)-N(7))-methyltransferase RsmG [Bacteroidota bacterium]MDA1241846.1 16S rRNA (guanine(527)-N(7))-methyltransferase RsmG [Bacteroidota bacterium]
MTAREWVLPHFPNLTAHQLDQLDIVATEIASWNQKINVISRKDEAVMERHVLHSLGIAKVHGFQPATRVLDVGTGGGFPGIPLAIMFPETSFVLCDSIGKKIKVVEAVTEAAGLTNVKAIHARAEEVEGHFEFVVSRAVTRLAAFIPWVEAKVRSANPSGLAPGILYLKGGDLREELAEVGQTTKVHPLSRWFASEFFETKAVVHVDLSKPNIP